MKKLLLLSMLSFSCGDPKIVCWYGYYAGSAERVQGVNVYLKGRTGTWSSDVYGPGFKSLDEMNHYINYNRLLMCGSVQ